MERHLVQGRQEVRWEGKSGLAEIVFGVDGTSVDDLVAERPMVSFQEGEVRRTAGTCAAK